jgi:hypothetical protein
MSRIDYDMDIVKHFVRFDGWLNAFRHRHKMVKRAGNEREELTHPERVKLTHLGLQNGRSGQER